MKDVINTACSIIFCTGFHEMKRAFGKVLLALGRGGIKAASHMLRHPSNV